MTLILEVAGHGGAAEPVYHRLEKLPVHIGRGYGNDVILPDVYVSAQHAVIRADDAQGWRIESAAGADENPLAVNGRDVAAGAGLPLRAGDVLTLGRTQVRVLAPAMAVAPALRLQKSGWLARRIAQPRYAFALFALAMASAGLWGYYEVWSDEAVAVVAITVATAVTMTVIWAALWSLAGRVLTHRSHFMPQVALACIYLIASALLSHVLMYAQYLSSESVVVAGAGYIVNTALLGLLIYGSLSYATDMLRRKRAMAALYFSIGFAASIIALGYVNAQKFNENPQYAARLEPYLSGLAPARAPEDFMARNAALFRDIERGN